MILLPNSTYVELYSAMAEAILVEHHEEYTFGVDDPNRIKLYVTEENGDQNFTDEAQDLFEEYCSTVEGVLEAVGIGQDYDLAEADNMVVVAA